MPSTILRLVKLAKRFGSYKALAGVSLDIVEGEFLTIVGPSGSGKTTLVRLLVGMTEPSEGEIWLRDRRIDPIPANKRPMCMVFQSLALFPHRTVGQNIEFPLKIRGVDTKTRRRKSLELLELLRMPAEYHAKAISQCSGGEQQRIALARALAFDPELLFFDEPLSALDYRLRKILEKELKELHRRTGKTFVYITHSLEEAMVMSDRIAIMRDGCIEQVGKADEIYAHPSNRFVAEFMGEVNLFDIARDEDGNLQAPGLCVVAESFDAGKTPERGERGALMVRPEFIRLFSEDESDSVDFWIRGVLRDEFTLGSRLQYEIEIDSGMRVTVEKLREDRFHMQLGTTVCLGWDSAHSHFIREN